MIVGGEARKGNPAQGKVVTDSGQTLYVMIEPDDAQGTFVSGEKVLLVRQLGGTRFAAIPNPAPRHSLGFDEQRARTKGSDR